MFKRSRLTPPSTLVFLISLVLAVAAIVSIFYHIPRVGYLVAAHRFWILAAGYALLAAGVLFRSL